MHWNKWLWRVIVVVSVGVALYWIAAAWLLFVIARAVEQMLHQCGL